MHATHSVRNRLAMAVGDHHRVPAVIACNRPVASMKQVPSPHRLQHAGRAALASVTPRVAASASGILTDMGEVTLHGREHGGRFLEGDMPRHRQRSSGSAVDAATTTPAGSTTLSPN
jgi:hypothetical protein